MLITLLLVGYAAGAGATWHHFMQPYDFIESPRAKVGWLAFATAAAVLWPATWITIGCLSWWGGRCR